MNKLITRHDVEFELWDLNYHSAMTDPHGQLYYSSTQVKNLCNLQRKSDSAAKTLGNHTHKMAEAMLLGTHHELVQQVAKKNSKAYNEQKASLDAAGKSYSLLTKTEFDLVTMRKSQITPLVQGLRHNSILVESIGLVSSGTPKKTLTGLDSWAQPLAMKARPDLLIKDIDKEVWTIADWKTTSETSLPGIIRQIHSYNYYFSLVWYATVLQTLGYTINTKALLLVLPPKGELITLQLDLAQPAMAERYIHPLIQRPMDAVVAEFDNFDSGRTIELSVGEFKIDYKIPTGNPTDLDFLV